MDRVLLWLADGAFSDRSRRRRFLEKKVYLEAADQDLRSGLERAGFSVVCLRTPDRSGNDVRARLLSVLSMDALEMGLTRRDVREVVILSADAGLIPLVNRLQPLQVRVVTCARQGDAGYELMRRYADGVIHMAALREAASYQRTPRKWYQLRSPAPVVKPPFVRERPSALVGRVRAALSAGQEGGGDGDADLLRAAERLDELGRHLPDQPLARVSVLRSLETIAAFSAVPRPGVKPWLGQKNYSGLLKRLAALRPCLEVLAGGQRDVQLVWRAPLAAPSAPAPPLLPDDAGDEPAAVLDGWARLSQESFRPGLLSGPDPADDTADGPSGTDAMPEGEAGR